MGFGLGWCVLVAQILVGWLPRFLVGGIRLGWFVGWFWNVVWLGWFIAGGWQREVLADWLGVFLERCLVDFLGVRFARADWFLGACFLLFCVVVFWCRQFRRYERGS